MPYMKMYGMHPANAGKTIKAQTSMRNIKGAPPHMRERHPKRTSSIETQKGHPRTCGKECLD